MYQILIDREHGSSAERVTGVNADRVDILDKAYGDHVVVLVADDFQLKLFPAKDRLLDENLVDQTGLKAAGAHCPKFIFIIYKAAAGASHRIRGAKDYRITQLIGNPKRFLH